MARFVFKLPDVGEGTAEAEIVAWHVKVGERIREDAPLVDVMTDKATVEMTSPVDGVVLERGGDVGDMAAVGAALVVIETDVDASAAPSDAGSAASAPVAGASNLAPAPDKPPSADAPAAAPSPPARPLTQAGSHRPLASPAVRRRAEELGLVLSEVPGSGPAGRIVHEDLEAFIARRSNPALAAPAPALADTVEEIKVIGLRRRIAEKMQDAKRRIPHFAYVDEVDMTEAEALRRHLNEAYPDRPRLTLTPFFARAMIKALAAFPQINARFDDEAGVVRRYAAVHLGVAVQTPQGLMVPVVRHAEALSLWAFSDEVARLAAAARAGKAKSQELSGSTITLTSLGPLGGVATTPVINAPEVAIIGPNRVIDRPVVQHGQIVIRKMMNLSSSFDHRVVDGYDAAAFIQRVRGFLEHPASLFVE